MVLLPPPGTHGSHGCRIDEREKVTSEVRNPTRSGAVRRLLELHQIDSCPPPSDPLLLRWILPFNRLLLSPWLQKRERDEMRRAKEREVYLGAISMVAADDNDEVHAAAALGMKAAAALGQCLPPRSGSGRHRARDLAAAVVL